MEATAPAAAPSANRAGSRIAAAPGAGLEPLALEALAVVADVVLAGSNRTSSVPASPGRPAAGALVADRGRRRR